MKEHWRRAWFVWVWLILEILGQQLIGGNSPIYSLFTAGIVAIFELYILLKFPHFEKLLIYEKSANNPKYMQIRWMGLIPILAVSYFSRTSMWYFPIYHPLTEMAALYFFGTEEEKNKARADIFDNIEGIAIAVIVLIVILVPYSIYHSKWMHAQFDKISASANSSHRPASPSR